MDERPLHENEIIKEDPDHITLQPINEWDPTTLVDYATVIVTARRRSGKTVFAKNVIAKNRKRYDEIYIFSSTIDKPANAAEYSFIPAQNRFTFLDEDKVRQILQKQDEILNFNATRPKGEQVKSHVCIILDDILTDPKFRRPNNVVDELFVQGRHSYITCFVLAQTFSGREGVGPILRKNADLIVSFFQHNINDRKAMAEQFLSLENAKVGAEYLRQITNVKHTACVIDVNNVGARTYTDYVFKYLAPNKKLPKFMIGDSKKRIREEKRSIITSNKSMSRKRETVPIKTAPTKKSKQGKVKCNFVIRTADMIDHSRSSINCDEGYQF